MIQRELLKPGIYEEFTIHTLLRKGDYDHYLYPLEDVLPNNYSALMDITDELNMCVHRTTSY